MSDMYFKSLPDKSTPLIPSNLDKLNDIKVSPTQPTTNEKVWIQKGKNLFNKNGYNLICGYVQSNTIYEEEGHNIIYIPCESNTTYTISKAAGKRFRVYCSENIPSVGSAITSLASEDKGTSLTVITNQNAKYLIVYLRSEYEDTLTLQEMLDTLQIEQGPATEYEAYVEEKVWVRNDNGVYIPFVPENKPINIATGIEFETGRIIDGKKEYGKRINCGALPNATTKETATGLSNVTYTKIEAIAYNSSGYVSLPVVSATSTSSNIYIAILYNQINIKTATDYSAYTNCYVTVYYTKN